jgi:rubrerythrin
MNLEEQAAKLQQQKAEAKLTATGRDRLLAELVDTVSLLCHQVSSLESVTEGLNETMDTLQAQVDIFFEEEEVLGQDEYYDGTERPLYEVKCPQCGDTFAVDEASLVKGFSCPNCGQHLVQA